MRRVFPGSDREYDSEFFRHPQLLVSASGAVWEHPKVLAIMLRTLSESAYWYLLECCGRSLRAPERTDQVASGAAWERPQVLVRMLRALPTACHSASSALWEHPTVIAIMLRTLPGSAHKYLSECFGRSQLLVTVLRALSGSIRKYWPEWFGRSLRAPTSTCQNARGAP